MLNTNKLQDDVMAREEARIKSKREANEQRRVRYLNAKVRLIGLDVQTLDQQVAEKQRMRQTEKDADRFERTQAMEIERILAQSMDEERRMKEFQITQVRNDWNRAIDEKRVQDAVPRGPDFDNANCGPASALKFFGEDNSRGDRLKQQKDQMRKWIQEQVAEKAQLKHLQYQDDMSFADMLKAIDEIRANAEREEKDLRQYIEYSNKDYNKELAVIQRERNRTLNKVMGDVPTSLDLFNEDKCTAMDEFGRIIRRDMFKGFTEEQKRKIMLDNIDILKRKSDEREADRMQEYDWAVHQVMTLRAMEQAEFEEKAMRDARDNDRYDQLKQQIDEQRKNRNEWNKTKYGSINGGFFDGFGQSCR